MSRPLTCPHLPDTVVTSCLVSGMTPPSVIQKLQDEYHINVLRLYGQMTGDTATVHHPDRYFMPYGVNTTYVAKNICSIKGEVPQTIREGLQDDQNADYKTNDRCLNAVILGETWIGNSKTASPKIYKQAVAEGKRIVSVKQGYTKCNICIVDRKALVTEDAGIAKACADAGIDVLLLRTHAVKLPPYAYGFIGGASGKIASDKLAFFGCIEKHPEYDLIRQFLLRYGVTAVSLYNGPLIDLGSLMPLTQGQPLIHL